MPYSLSRCLLGLLFFLVSSVLPFSSSLVMSFGSSSLVVPASIFRSSISSSLFFCVSRSNRMKYSFHSSIFMSSIILSGFFVPYLLINFHASVSFFTLRISSSSVCSCFFFCFLHHFLYSFLFAIKSSLFIFFFRFLRAFLNSLSFLFHSLLYHSLSPSFHGIILFLFYDRFLYLIFYLVSYAV